MSEFKDYTGYCSPYGRHRVPSVSVEKREALKKKFHPLLAAAFFGYVDVTKILLSEGKANIHFQDDFEKTALHWAVEADHPDVIQVLLERGAGIKYPRKNKITKSPFVYAAELGNKYAVELMVNELRNRGSQFDLRVLKDQSGKACYEACRNGYSDIVDFLLRQGVDVNLPIEQRRLLYWATIKGNLSTVKVLVKHGARMEHENDCGVVTALISSGSSRKGDVRMSVSAEKALHMLRSGCNVANGDILACALWCIAKCSGTTGHQWYAASDQREEMMRLMRKNGFDEKNWAPKMELLLIMLEMSYEKPLMLSERPHKGGGSCKRKVPPGRENVICAIGTEYVAAQAFLDKRHGLPVRVSPGDCINYTLGTIVGHYVDIAVLPNGEYGITSAAIVAMHMLRSFPNVRVGLMVGIGGRVPSAKHDIRLGDIVVSSPFEGQGGVVQYDFGKAIQRQSCQHTRFLDQPPMILQTAVSGLSSQYEIEGHNLHEAVCEILEQKPRLRGKYKRPDLSTDQLYHSNVIHPSSGVQAGGCAAMCGDKPPMLISRKSRAEDKDNPMIQ
ncbi:Pfs, NACHT and Ankyrin domain protein [Talaromyces pinophilus]|uniref:Pfs, NACHT and Ankyrin domain protein n=1 Tax=Talaromyces pinophilus TaxID=128442 RepID=A0A6V8H249_TALPI|nr:Pfs, NACHT and Ankyrin domain protein [Talaromyces pinophilus]